MAKKVLLSGIQPSGAPHIGNYFGALKQWVDFQNRFQSYAMIADYHALTSVTDAKTLRDNTYNVALDLLAVGLDPKKVVIFKQSDVPEHAELAWIFNCIMTMPWLMRAHAFKDKTGKGLEANVGLFDYPILMAADILLYNTQSVPVGKDQKQHVEMAREVAQKFNNTFGKAFTIPQEYIPESVAVVPGIDGQKMSKSYGNTIPLFGTDEEIKRAVMSIVTDSSGDMPKNVYALHKLFRTEKQLEKLYEKKKGKYKELKEALFVDIMKVVAPMRKKREALAKNPKKVHAILKAGAVKARKQAQKKMMLVRKLVGLA